METPITYESVLNLIREQSLIFNRNLDRERKERELSNKKFEENLEKERKEREKSRIDFENNLEKERKEREKSRKEFDKKLGELTGTWGKFVSEMVTPKLVDMFRERGIPIETTLEKIKGLIDKQEYYEIDLLLINTKYAVAVEVKSTLNIAAVDEHIERLKKIQKVCPKRVDLAGMSILGAVAGMIIEEKADLYAYRKGLFVLRQKGNIVEIVNDKKFQPVEWIVEY